MPEAIQAVRRGSLERAQHYIESGNLHAAIMQLNNILNWEPITPEVVLAARQTGILHYMINRPEQAVLYLKKACQLACELGDKELITLVYQRPRISFQRKR